MCRRQIPEQARRLYFRGYPLAGQLFLATSCAPAAVIRSRVAGTVSHEPLGWLHGSEGDLPRVGDDRLVDSMPAVQTSLCILGGQ